MLNLERNDESIDFASCVNDEVVLGIFSHSYM